MTHDHDSSIATGRTPEQFGVQAWSQGEIYPAVIAVRERYDARTHGMSERNLVGYPCSRSFVLMLDGIEEEYATHADAEEVARALLGSPFLRAQWSQGREFDTAEARYESETAGEWQERLAREEAGYLSFTAGPADILALERERAAEIAEATRTGANSL